MQRIDIEPRHHGKGPRFLSRQELIREKTYLNNPWMGYVFWSTRFLRLPVLFLGVQKAPHKKY